MDKDKKISDDWKNMSYSAKRELEENRFLFEDISSSIVEQRAKSCLIWYVRKATRNRCLYYFWSVIGIGSPLIATVFTSIDVQEMSTFSVVALVFTLIASLSSSILCLWNFKSEWRDYRDTAEMLKREWTDYKRRLEELKEGKLWEKEREQQSDSEKVEESPEMQIAGEKSKLDEQFLERIEQYMAQTHKSWMSKFTQEKGDGKKDN